MLIFVEKFECYVINVHSIKQEILLKMQDDNLLRGLFLAYQAVESTEDKENILLEVFKFAHNKTYLTHFFEPLFAFIMKKGTFSQPKIKQMLKYSLTPQQRKSKMVARLSLADTWEAVGEARGEARGVKKQARLTVLRGYFNGVQTDILLLLCGLPQSEVFALGKDYETVKKAWKNKGIDIAALAKDTSLTEEEIKFVLTCLESVSMA